MLLGDQGTCFSTHVPLSPCYRTKPVRSNFTASRMGSQAGGQLPQVSSQMCPWAATGVVYPIPVYCSSKSLGQLWYKRKEIQFFLLEERQGHRAGRRYYCRSLENTIFHRGMLIELSLFSQWCCWDLCLCGHPRVSPILDHPCCILTHSVLFTGKSLLGPMGATLSPSWRMLNPEFSGVSCVFSLFFRLTYQTSCF